MLVSILIICIAICTAFYLGRLSKLSSKHTIPTQGIPASIQYATVVDTPEGVVYKTTLRKALRQMETDILNSGYMDFQGIDNGTKASIKIKLTK